MTSLRRKQGVQPRVDAWRTKLLRRLLLAIPRDEDVQRVLKMREPIAPKRGVQGWGRKRLAGLIAEALPGYFTSTQRECQSVQLFDEYVTPVRKRFPYLFSGEHGIPNFEHVMAAIARFAAARNSSSIASPAFSPLLCVPLAPSYAYRKQEGPRRGGAGGAHDVRQHLHV